jgi:hypothetical protein
MTIELHYILYNVLVFIVGLFVGYLVTYFKKKGENKALKEDIANITKEKEKVIADFRLDHEKRKYKFERRYEVYSKYLSLLDKFDSENNPFKNNNKMDTLVSQLLNSVYNNTENEGKRMEAINSFSNAFNILIRESVAGLKEIANEVNEMKLVAPAEIVSLINKIQLNYDQVEKLSALVLENPVKLFSGNEDFSSVNKGINKLGSETKEMKRTLITLMNEDLDKI